MDDPQQMRLTAPTATSSSCVKVFIQRDYSEGVGVKFETKLPQELSGKISAHEFEEVIERINQIYADAERINARTYLENCFACLTAYLLLICLTTNYEKNVKRASEFIANENERLFIPKGLLMVDPMERGLRCIEICIINEQNLQSSNNNRNNVKMV